MAPALSSTRLGGQLDESGGELRGLGVTERGERAPEVEVDGSPHGRVDALAAAPAAHADGSRGAP